MENYEGQIDKGGHYDAEMKEWGMWKLKGRMNKGGHYDVEMKGWMENCGIMMCKLKGRMEKGGHYDK